MATWFTSDHHFGHEGILSPDKHCRRGAHFSSIEEHDRALVDLWNSVVRPGDTVHHLGDFAYKCSFEHADRIFKKLHGTKHLILGNHDKLASRLQWASVQDFAQISVPGPDKNYHLILMHYAMRTWPRKHKGSLMLYGHSHGAMPGCRQSLDVGVDCWGFRPVSLEEILKAIADNPESTLETWQMAAE